MLNCQIEQVDLKMGSGQRNVRLETVSDLYLSSDPVGTVRIDSVPIRAARLVTKYPPHPLNKRNHDSDGKDRNKHSETSLSFPNPHYSRQQNEKQHNRNKK